MTRGLPPTMREQFLAVVIFRQAAATGAVDANDCTSA